ncbi:hypothetical protein [Streptomyces palmae]|uniref:Uncharacterized protein n=1 Tax=Streptomyces palmae TaxID=1701085 RepID=A0A4Z0GJH9_9ACTN|nr:hypothetical protein [Streptomyces palmae]TGA95454.1 hypothetical protein E4099_25315 [Streptomyces palmae]
MAALPALLIVATATSASATPGSSTESKASFAAVATAGQNARLTVPGDEWPVAPGDEWPVAPADEWPVAPGDEWPSPAK